MPFIEIHTGAKLFYEHTNQAPGKIPILAIHGMLGTGRKDLGHVIDWLASQSYEVIAPTLRGYGLSEPKPRDFPPRFYDRDAADVMAFMDALGIRQAHLIGYSDGGETALICAGTHPQRFVSVACWGAVGYFGPSMRAIAQRMIPGSAWLKPDEMARHGIINADAFAQQWVRSTIQMIDSGGDVSRHLAPNITAPLLMMLGKRDHLNPKEFASNFLAHAKHGQLKMFDAGHALHDEQTEEFRRILLAHLQAAET